MSSHFLVHPRQQVGKGSTWTLPIPANHQTASILKPVGTVTGSHSTPAKRTKIWELANTLHCSIVGTCLSTAELRHVLARLKVADIEGADEHQIHMIGVTLASRRDAGAALLQKALDRRHERAIRQFGKAKDMQSVAVLWRQSVESGDIPGAYWATLTHPAATSDLIKKVFGDVHMLSHIVGAANRADIRRLRQLEEENAALAAKVARQQGLLHDGFAERDATIRRLKDALAGQIAEDGTQAATLNEHSPEPDLQAVVGDLHHRLGAETARRERLGHRLDTLTHSLREKEQALRSLEQKHAALTQELNILEAQLAGSDDSVEEQELTARLANMTILYVGGRPQQIAQLKRLVEQKDGQFLHHDGGIDQNGTLLPGLVSRADTVFFPVDCISHDAALTIKRVCRNMEKPYHPLRTASLASFWSVLASRRQTASTPSGK